jgi:hypothetical protein
MGAQRLAIAVRMAGCGRLSLTTAVSASAVSTAVTGANIDWNGWLSREARIENATSSDVMALPSWNLRLGRSFTVTLRPSFAMDQLSARSPSGLSRPLG